MSANGTRSYARFDGRVPNLVGQAVAGANRLGFDLCVRPEIGRLLAALAGGLPAGAIVGETGTGTGAGLGWMVAAANPDVEFISYELDAGRASVAADVFVNHDNVEVVHGDAAQLFGGRRFDLLVLDGGPAAGKRSGSVPVEPADVLAPGGTITIDDFTPARSWPPMFEGERDHSRLHWLEHRDLRAIEIQVAPDLSVIVGRYLPPA